jgi:hypothetical protein
MLGSNSSNGLAEFESIRAGELPSNGRPWLVSASPAGEPGLKDQLLDLSYNPAPTARTEINMARGDAATGSDQPVDYSIRLSPPFTENCIRGIESRLRHEANFRMRAYAEGNERSALRNELERQRQRGVVRDEFRKYLKRFPAQRGLSAAQVDAMSDAEVWQEFEIMNAGEDLTDEEFWYMMKPVGAGGDEDFQPALNYDSRESSAVADYLYGQGGGPPPEWFRAQMAWIRSLEAGGWLRGYGGDIDPADPNADAGIGAAGAPCGSDGRFLGDPSGPDHPGIGTSHTDPQAGGDIDYEEAPVQTNGQYNEYNVSGSHDDGTAGIRLSNGNGRLSEENEALTRARLGGS